MGLFKSKKKKAEEEKKKREEEERKKREEEERKKREEEQKKAEEAKKDIEVEAQKGDNLTKMARKAAEQHAQEKAESLTPEQKVYAEDYLAKKKGYSPNIEVGQREVFSREELDEAVKQAKDIDPTPELTRYAQRAGFKDKMVQQRQALEQQPQQDIISGVQQQMITPEAIRKNLEQRIGPIPSSKEAEKMQKEKMMENIQKKVGPIPSDKEIARQQRQMRAREVDLMKTPAEQAGEDLKQREIELMQGKQQLTEEERQQYEERQLKQKEIELMQEPSQEKKTFTQQLPGLIKETGKGLVEFGKEAIKERAIGAKEAYEEGGLIKSGLYNVKTAAKDVATLAKSAIQGIGSVVASTALSVDEITGGEGTLGQENNITRGIVQFVTGEEEAKSWQQRVSGAQETVGQMGGTDMERKIYGTGAVLLVAALDAADFTSLGAGKTVRKAVAKELKEKLIKEAADMASKEGLKKIPKKAFNAIEKDIIGVLDSKVYKELPEKGKEQAIRDIVKESRRKLGLEDPLEKEVRIKAEIGFEGGKEYVKKLKEGVPKEQALDEVQKEVREGRLSRYTRKEVEEMVENRKFEIMEETGMNEVDAKHEAYNSLKPAERNLLIKEKEKAINKMEGKINPSTLDEDAASINEMLDERTRIVMQEEGIQDPEAARIEAFNQLNQREQDIIVAKNKKDVAELNGDPVEITPDGVIPIEREVVEEIPTAKIVKETKPEKGVPLERKMQEVKTKPVAFKKAAEAPKAQQPTKKPLEKKIEPYKGEIEKAMGIKTMVKKGKEVKESRVFRRLKENLGNEYRNMDLKYTPMSLKEDAKKAARIINKDPDKALRMATGLEDVPNDQTATSLNIMLSEKAAKEGNHKLQAELVANRSLRLTKMGREIVAEKGSVAENSVSSFLKEVMNARMKNIKFKEGTSLKGMFKEAKNSLSGAMEEISKGANRLKKTISKAKELDMSAAQAIFDKLACKT